MEYHFKIHRDRKGYWAECIELGGCFTQGRNRRELEKNMREALNAYLDEAESSKVLFALPGPNRSTKNVVAVPVDPRVAFAFVLRRERLSKGLTQKETAGRLRVSLYGYQRLESSRTANPRWSTIVRLLSIFPGLLPGRLVA